MHKIDGKLVIQQPCTIKARLMPFSYISRPCNFSSFASQGQSILGCWPFLASVNL